MDRFEPGAIERVETVSLTVWLNSDGALSRVEPFLASSPEAERNAIEALKGASPYPPLERYAGCRLNQPLMVLLSLRLNPDCDLIPEVVAYREAVFQQIVNRFNTTRDPAEAGHAVLILTLKPDGGVANVSVTESSSDHITARARASVSGAAPFASPPEFAACAHLPLFLSLETPE